MIHDLRPYPAMKDSGVPWLGQVPEHWNVVKIKRLFAEKEERVESHIVPLLSLTRAQGLVTHASAARRIASVDDLSRYKVCEPGDLVMNRMQAWSGMFSASELRGAVSPDYSVFQMRVEGSVKFFEHLFKVPSVVDQFAQASRGIGTGFNRLYTPDFGAVEVVAPPPDEQAAIVRFLDHADRRIRKAIAAKQKLIRLLQEQKQVIIHQAVTRGLDPNVGLKPSGVEWLGDVPEWWEVVPISRVLDERKEKNNPVKTTHILSLGLSTGVIPYSEKKTGGNKAKEDISQYMLAYPGDIVVNSMNVVVGSVGLSKYYGAVSPAYYMLRIRQKDDSIEYYDSVFQDAAFQRSLFGLGNEIMFIQSRSTGKLNTIRLKIPISKLKRVLVPHPPYEEQIAVVKHLVSATTGVNDAIAHAQQEISLLREYRTRLTADVVTGKLDVRGAASLLPEPAEEAVPEELEADVEEGELEPGEVEAEVVEA